MKNTWRYKLEKHLLHKSTKIILRKNKINRRKERLKKKGKQRSLIDRRKYTTPLTKFLKSSKMFKAQNLHVKKKKISFTVPDIFSFTENPDETLNFLQKLLNIDDSISEISIDHTECKMLGIGASTVMDIIIINIEKERAIRGKKFNLSGLVKAHSDVYEMLYVSGLLNHLNITNDNPDPDRIIKFEMISGNGNPSTNQSGIAATKVTEYFMECLETQGYSLSDEGKWYFSLILGEVIGNCEIHSGKEFCQWYVHGHYSLNERENYGIFHLTVFNFGQTIYEGLKNECENLKIKESLQKMSLKHKGFFGIGGWDEENLWTLYSLQDGVSRKKKDERHRGTGTIRLIDSFQEIGQTYDGRKSVMSIISGSSCIYFNNLYRLEPKNFDGTLMKVIAFNETNDLNLPPDKSYVIKLNNYFPGTVISMKFYIDCKYLEEVMK